MENVEPNNVLTEEQAMMNNDSYLVFERNGVLTLVAEHKSIADADTQADASGKAIVVTRRLLKSAKISNSEFVDCFNKLTKGEAVRRFSDKESAARRVLEAWDIAQGRTPELTTTEHLNRRADKAARLREQDAIIANSTTKENDMMSKTAKASKKKAAAPPSRKARIVGGTVHIVKQPSAEKIWHTGSLRKKMWDYLTQRAPVKLESVLNSSIGTRPQNSSLLQKLQELGFIAVKE